MMATRCHSRQLRFTTAADGWRVESDRTTVWAHGKPKSHNAVFAADTTAGAVGHVRNTRRHRAKLAAGGKKVYVFRISMRSQQQQGRAFCFKPFGGARFNHDGSNISSVNVDVDASMVTCINP